MNYRLATILAREGHTSDTTKVIDLNLSNSVTQFVIICEAMGGADAAPVAHVAKCIDKIELVDGSDVLFSLSGIQSQGVDWYHRKQEPANIFLNFNNMNAEMVYNLNFGRFLFDPIYAFDPLKFTNPQLKITLDINGGGSNTDALNITVLAHIFDEKAVTPEGFLMQKELVDYALGAGTHEYVDLPTDQVIRKLFLSSLIADVGADYIFNTVKLSENNDQRIPIDNTISEILKAITGRGRPYREKQLGPGNLNEIKYRCTPTYWPAGVATFWTGTCPAGMISFYGGDGGRFSLDMNTATANWQALIEGHCPHGVVEIPFGLQDDPADWYDVTKLGSLRLDILSHSGRSSSDSCQVLLQQLRKYAA